MPTDVHQFIFSGEDDLPLRLCQLILLTFRSRRVSRLSRRPALYERTQQIESLTIISGLIQSTRRSPSSRTHHKLFVGLPRKVVPKKSMSHALKKALAREYTENGTHSPPVRGRSGTYSSLAMREKVISSLFMNHLW